MWEDLLLAWHGWVGGKAGVSAACLYVCSGFAVLCWGTGKPSLSRALPQASVGHTAQSDDVMESRGGSCVKGAEHFCWHPRVVVVSQEAELHLGIGLGFAIAPTIVGICR